MVLFHFVWTLKLFPSRQRLLWSQYSVCSSQMWAKQQLWRSSVAVKLLGRIAQALLFTACVHRAVRWDRRSLSPICLCWVWNNIMMQAPPFLSWFRTRAVQSGVRPFSHCISKCDGSSFASTAFRSYNRRGRVNSAFSHRARQDAKALILCINYCP